MKSARKTQNQNTRPNLRVIETKHQAQTKRERILQTYQQESQDIGEIAFRVGVRPSYVAQVLQKEGLIASYFDLYTHTQREQNIYSKAFRNVLAFRTVEAAQNSVKRINELYEHYHRQRDRAGQHQAMVIALIGFNRARWSGKIEQATQFRNWLIDQLNGQQPQRVATTDEVMTGGERRDISTPGEGVLTSTLKDRDTSTD
jgi:hypothetical protein